MQATRLTKNGATLRHCCPRQNLEDDRARRTCEMYLMLFCTWHPRAVSGACFRTITRRSRQFADIFTTGATTAFFERSTTIWSWLREKPWAVRPVQRRAWSIVRALKPRKVAAFGAMMRVRKSTDVSAISSPIRRDCSSVWPSMVPTSKIEMALPQLSTRSAMRFRGFDTSSLTADMQAPNSGVRWTKSDNGRCKSSSDPMWQRASNFSPVDGWSSERLHGLVAAVDWQKIGNKPLPARKRGYSSLTYDASVDFSQGADII